jgi:hypothetical protein
MFADIVVSPRCCKTIRVAVSDLQVDLSLLKYGSQPMES